MARPKKEETAEIELDIDDPKVFTEAPPVTPPEPVLGHLCKLSDEQHEKVKELRSFLGELLRRINDVPSRQKIKDFQSLLSVIADDNK